MTKRELAGLILNVTETKVMEFSKRHNTVVVSQRRAPVISTWFQIPRNAETRQMRCNKEMDKVKNSIGRENVHSNIKILRVNTT